MLGECVFLVVEEAKQGLVADPGQFGGIFILCYSEGVTGDHSQWPGFGVPDSKGSHVLPRVSSSPCHILGVPSPIFVVLSLVTASGLDIEASCTLSLPSALAGHRCDLIS